MCDLHPGACILERKLFCFEVLGRKPEASRMLGKCCTTELHLSLRKEDGEKTDLLQLRHRREHGLWQTGCTVRHHHCHPGSSIETSIYLGWT
jgi:hypothetical protein